MNTSKTLAGSTLLKMGILISLAVVILSFLSFLYVNSIQKKQIIRQLDKYIVERGQRESIIFLNAISLHEQMKADFIARLNAYKGEHIDEAFDAIWELKPDGTTRMRPEYYYGKEGEHGRKLWGMYGVFGKNIEISREMKKQSIVAYDMVRDYGPAMRSQYINLYLSGNDNYFPVSRWPEVSWYLEEAPADSDFTKEDWIYMGMPAYNRERKSAWTKLYYDKSGSWMVSCITPIDINGKHVGSWGTDILLKEFFDRTLTDKLSGSYNILLSQEGDLIAHPEIMENLKDPKLNLTVYNAGDAHLERIFKLVKNREKGVTVIDNGDDDEFLAIGHINGPDWFLITLFPKSIYTNESVKTAKFIFFLGVLLLIIELFILYGVINTNVTKPLHEFIEETQHIAEVSAISIMESGVHAIERVSSKLPLTRQDELGVLAFNFDKMTQQINASFEFLEEKVRERTADLEEEKLKAEAANKAKSVFLSNMSHEIRTPMNSILGFSEILKERNLNTEEEEFVDIIYRNGESLLKLIDDILDLSKVEAGKLELEYKPTSIQKLFKEMERLFSQKILGKGLEFRLAIDEHIPEKLLLDVARLRQVLVNIIGNALKFTDTGYISLKASATFSEKNDYLLGLTIDVEDTGIGIPEDEQEAIFKAFEQMQNQKVDKYGGTGLGLTISEGLIELMGGRIKLKSFEGKGSIFSIELHHVELALDNDLDPSASDEDLNITFAEARILLVDDIDFNLQLLRRFLEGFPFEFYEAKSGIEALQEAERVRPDLILLDMKMPGLDGYEVARRLGADEELKDIPIIAVTASALKEDEILIKQICSGYLRKPVRRARLLREMKRFLK